MKPKPFKPEYFNGVDNFVMDLNSGLLWHRHQYRTLYIDTDRSQVVYHSNYLKYFEVGRAELMRDTAYPYREVEESGFVYPIVEIGVKYFKPLFYDDSMWIHTRPGNRERVKLQFDYVITHGTNYDIVCTGFTKHCALNKSGKPVEIDEKTVHLWETFPKQETDIVSPSK